MNYLDDLYNAKELYNVSHKEKANETILGIDCYSYIKNRVKHMSKKIWQPVFNDKGILRQVLGLNIKIDYFRPNLIEVKRNPYLKSSIDFIWLSEEEMKKEVDDELSEMMDNDIKDLHKFIEFERYYEDRNNKEDL